MLRVDKAKICANTYEGKEQGREDYELLLNDYKEWDEIVCDMMDYFNVQEEELIFTDIENVPISLYEKDDDGEIVCVDDMFFDIIHRLSQWEEPKREAFCKYYCEEIGGDWVLDFEFNEKTKEMDFPLIEKWGKSYNNL